MAHRISCLERESFTASVDAAISASDRTLCRISDTLQLTIFYAAAQSVKVSLSDEDVFVGFLELNDDTVHPIDRLLEGLEVLGDGHDVLVQSRDLELVVLEVA